MNIPATLTVVPLPPHEILQKFVHAHPAQLEIAEQLARPGGAIRNMVRDEIEKFDATLLAMQKEKFPLMDPTFLALGFKYLYNRRTDLGESRISALLAVREIFGIPLGARPTSETVIDGISWNEVYPEYVGSYLSSRSAKQSGGKKRSQNSKRRSR